jgi:hypothetical protein
MTRRDPHRPDPRRLPRSRQKRSISSAPLHQTSWSATFSEGNERFGCDRARVGRDAQLSRIGLLAAGDENEALRAR